MDIEIKKKKRCPECDDWSMELNELETKWVCTVCGYGVEIQ